MNHDSICFGKFLIIPYWIMKIWIGFIGGSVIERI
jgi:hypothetical protein